MLGMAMASLLSELIQAQMATLLWGGLIAKYTLSMGLFILALGLGSFYQAKNFAGASLAWQQMLMAALAILSPWSILWAGTHLIPVAAWATAGFSVFLVGFCSGMEFPLLANVAQKQVAETSSFIFSDLLRVDYMGMGLSSLLFPVFLLKHIGIFKASLLAAALNLVIAQSIFQLHPAEFQAKGQRFKFLSLLVFAIGLIICLWLSNEPLTALAQTWIVE